jgi:lysophospholipase
VVLPDCPPPYFALAHSMGATVVLRAVARGQRWFDRVVLSAPMLGIAFVQSTALASTLLRVMRFGGFGGMYVPGRYPGVLDLRPFAGNILTSDPVRYARNAAILEAEPALGLGGPTITWCDAAFRAMRAINEPSFIGRVRQPILIIAAGRDVIVSNNRIEDFAMQMRAGSHLVVVGSQHELLMEQDRYRSQFWAAFDAFVPGTPLF